MAEIARTRVGQKAVKKEKAPEFFGSTCRVCGHTTTGPSRQGVAATHAQHQKQTGHRG